MRSGPCLGTVNATFVQPARDDTYAGDTPEPGMSQAEGQHTTDCKRRGGSQQQQEETWVGVAAWAGGWGWVRPRNLCDPLLGGSWAVVNRVVSAPNEVIRRVVLLTNLLATTRGSCSTQGRRGLFTPAGLG